jgi:predicted phosphodiesterase
LIQMLVGAGVMGGGLPSSFTDEFTRADGAIGNGWTGSTWTISSNAALNTPGLGENIAGDPGMGDTGSWNKNGNWSIAGGVASHASGATIDILSQLILTAKSYYRCDWTITSFTSGIGLNFRAGGATVIGPARNSAATFIDTLRADNVTGAIRASTTAIASVDNVTFKLITFKDLFAVKEYSSSHGSCQGTWNIASGVQFGQVMCLDNPNNPLNFVICYQNGNGYLVMDKCVNGTYTNLVSDLAEPANGKSILLTRVAGTNTFQAFYGVVGSETQVGTDITIDDAGIINNKYHGLFATNSQPKCLDFFFTVADESIDRLSWISDLHFGSATWDAGETDAIADQIAAVDPSIGLCGGDIANLGLADEYTAYLAFVARTGKTYYPLAGNHDGGDITNYNAAGLVHHWVVDRNNIRFIGFESTSLVESPDWTGQVSVDELTWLETQLQGAGGNSIVVMTHYPLQFTQNIVTRATELMALLNTYGVRVYLSGHAHGNLESAVVDGTTHINGGAMIYTNESSPGGIMFIENRRAHLYIKMIQNVSPWGLLHAISIKL